MWLAVDCGNSRIKWALIAASHRPLHTDAVQVYALDNRRYPSQLKKDAQQADSLWISCVGSGRKKLQPLVTNLGKRVHWLKANAHGGGINNAYHKPTTLGSDRWLSLIAAAHYRRDVVVIDAGTAATIDVLRADAHFVGGVILPGVLAMQAQLSQHTTLPPPVLIPKNQIASHATKNNRPATTSATNATTAIAISATSAAVTDVTITKNAKDAMPRTTKDGMQQGAVLAIAGAASMLRQQHLPKARYIITGGDAELLLPHLPATSKHIPYLPLHGLARLRAMTKTVNRS